MVIRARIQETKSPYLTASVRQQQVELECGHLRQVTHLKRAEEEFAMAGFLTKMLQEMEVRYLESEKTLPKI